MRFNLNILLVITLLFACSQKCISQDSTEFENYSSYIYSNLSNPAKFNRSNNSYDSLIIEVLEIIGIPNSDIVIRGTSSFGAFAAISRNCRQRFILYNESFFDSLYAITNSYDAIKSVGFHEVAHHLYRHPLKSRWDAYIHELEADRYSGYQMRLIGSTIDQSIAAMEHFGNYEPNDTHPEKDERIKQIISGYLDADARFFNNSESIKLDSLFEVEQTVVALNKVLIADNLYEGEIPLDNPLFSEFSDFIQSENPISAFQDSPNYDELLNSLTESYSRLDVTLKSNDFFQFPTYSMLGKIFFINENNEVIDLATNEIIGDLRIPYENAGFEILRFESSSYRIENDEIYSTIKFGDPIKLGTKIN